MHTLYKNNVRFLEIVGDDYGWHIERESETKGTKAREVCRSFKIRSSRKVISIRHRYYSIGARSFFDYTRAFLDHSRVFN
jgi:hypothetical protein